MNPLTQSKNKTILPVLITLTRDVPEEHSRDCARVRVREVISRRPSVTHCRDWDLLGIPVSCEQTIAFFCELTVGKSPSRILQ
jgi:hypothetical protein